jgi:hypothetical protein
MHPFDRHLPYSEGQATASQQIELPPLRDVHLFASPRPLTLFAHVLLDVPRFQHALGRTRSCRSNIAGP